MGNFYADRVTLLPSPPARTEICHRHVNLLSHKISWYDSNQNKIKQKPNTIHLSKRPPLGWVKIFANIYLKTLTDKELLKSTRKRRTTLWKKDKERINRQLKEEEYKPIRHVNDRKDSIILIIKICKMKQHAISCYHIGIWYSVLIRKQARTGRKLAPPLEDNLDSSRNTCNYYILWPSSFPSKNFI